MGLKFRGDAIELSGETGTKPKSAILGAYYDRWWSITSGGESRGFPFPTAIIELNAGTGENFLSDANRTILGSSGHALKLKGENANTIHLKLILVESDRECFAHLKSVIARRWAGIRWSDQIADPEDARVGVYLLNMELPYALDAIDRMYLGNSLFFFDPLLFTRWGEIESVARKRIKSYYHTGTEFIVFLFTSDWFHGRPGLVSNLPTTNNQTKWTQDQAAAVSKVDSLFGHSEWRPRLLNERPILDRIQALVELYRERLHKWFRYVLPFPFAPKPNQVYHLFMCSNYEAGMRLTRDFYTYFTDNPKYAPDNDAAYAKFLKLHPEKRLQGAKKSDEWKILWTVIKNHEEGICDIYCKDIEKIQAIESLRRQALEWLASNGYLARAANMTDAWDAIPDIFRINWSYLKTKLDVSSPEPFRPLSSDSRRLR